MPLLRFNSTADQRRVVDPGADDLFDVLPLRLVQADLPVWLHDEGFRLAEANVFEDRWSAISYPIDDLRLDDRLIIDRRQYRIVEIENRNPVAYMHCVRLPGAYSADLPALSDLYAAIGPTADGAVEALSGTLHSARGAEGVVTVPDANVPQYIAFATAIADAAPTDIRETGNPFGARRSFLPAVDDDDVIVEITGSDGTGRYRAYVSVAAWSTAGLGRQWTVGTGD